MRLILPASAALTLLGAGAAHADPAYEAETATEACLAAVIDGAPVGDAQGQDVSVHRERNPNLCAVTVTGGRPDEARSAVLEALAKRAEGFAPAKSAWAPGALARRESFCNAPGRRALNLVIETAQPGASPVLVATVIEGRARDPRCDADLGLQQP